MENGTIYFYQCGNQFIKDIKFLFQWKANLLSYINRLVENIPWRSEEAKKEFDEIPLVKLDGTSNRPNFLRKRAILDDLKEFIEIDVHKCPKWRSLYKAPFFESDFSNVEKNIIPAPIPASSSSTKQVGRREFRSRSTIKYSHAEADKEGWSDPKDWLPHEYDLVYIDTGDRILTGWYGMGFWDGFRLKDEEEVKRWRVIPEMDRDWVGADMEAM